VKSLYNRKGQRRHEGERHSFAFFAVGAVVILAAVFVIGLQVGRVVERSADETDARAGKASTSAESRSAPAAATEIRKDLGSYSEEAAKVPVVPPPLATSTVSEVEKKLTFRETLANKEATTVPLAPAPKKAEGASTGDGAQKAHGAARYQVQAGAFREMKAAEARRKRIEKSGFQPRVVRTSRKNRDAVFRVLIGPFPDVEAAGKAVRRLKNELKIDALMIKG
jgi:cell division protein FtsN